MKQLTILVFAVLLSASQGFSSSNTLQGSNNHGSVTSDALALTTEANLGVDAFSIANQQIEVRGTVIDAMNGEPLPGANVTIAGTTTGVTSDVDGNFSINVPNQESVLQVTFVGYLTEEVTVGAEREFSINLIPDIQALEEIVVVGYGVMRKALVTGATSNVQSEDIQKSHSLRLEQALQGRSAGVNITSYSGQPGEGLKVRIRGVGTIGDNDPLFIVDGIPTSNIAYLNPNDIESIDILKDAASAAIYGARAANGVILITTKTGEKGRMDVSYDGYYGIQNPARKLPMLRADEYAVIMNEANLNSGGRPRYSLEEIEELGAGTDWQDYFFNYDAPMQNHSLNVSGGGERSIYSVSLSYTQQDGIVGIDNMSSYERVSGRINSTHDVIEDRFTLGQNFLYSNSTRRGLSVGGIYDNSLRGFLNAPPTFPAYDDTQEDGWGVPPISDIANPLAHQSVNNFRKNLNDNILGSIFAELNILKGLSFKTSYGFDLNFDTYNRFVPEYDLALNTQNPRSRAEQSLSRSNTWIWENTLTYDLQLGAHGIQTLAGTSAQENQYFRVWGQREDLIMPEFDYAVLDNATNNETQQTEGHRSEHALSSIFGRINYNFDERYMFTATVRRDGSTRFGPNNRYGIFPSVSAGWNISNEDFMVGLDWLNMFKVRGSWGQNGNERIDDFRYMATILSTQRDYYFGSEDIQYVGSSPEFLANPDLKWETSEQLNVGLDARFIGSLDVNFDWYKKTTKDWLIQAPVPDVVGFDAPYINGGTIVNTGVELAVSYRKRVGEFGFGVSGNVAYNQNEVTEINNEEKIIHGEPNIIFQGITQQYRTQVGYPIAYFYGLETDGIFQTQEDVDSYVNSGQVVQPNAQPGDVKFVDKNGDGVINSDDYGMIGKSMPDYNFGFNFDADYKGFDLSVSMNGVHGNQIIKGLRGHARGFNNYTTDILDRWHGEGTSNSVPRVTLGTEANKNYSTPSELFIEDGAFLRIRNVTLGYDIKEVLPVLPVQQFRLYVSAINLYTFTQYSGYDPEVGYGPDDYVMGFDVGFYQQPRTYLVGLNIKF